MENGAVIFRISPWTQYFDLKGQAPPKAFVHDIKIKNVHGAGSSFGEITGHDQATIQNITLTNADLQLKSSDLKLGKVQNLKFKNVKVNGKKMKAQTPTATVQK